MSKDDALDIPLSLDDFEDMDPADLKPMWDKVLQSRREFRNERDQLRTDIAQVRAELGRTQQLAQGLLKQAQERDARLSRVAMRLIDLGVLDTLKVEFEDAG